MFDIIEYYTFPITFALIYMIMYFFNNKKKVLKIDNINTVYKIVLETLDRDIKFNSIKRRKAKKNKNFYNSILYDLNTKVKIIEESLNET